MDSMVTKIKLFLSDVDGVLTDGSMYYTESGEEMKRFHTYDGVAFKLLRREGVITGIITSEITQIVKRRADKLSIDYLYQGKEMGGKLEAAMEICRKENISLSETAYIGDDINCIDLLNSVGFKACPDNATKRVKKLKNIVSLKKSGGEGVVREWYEYLFEKGLL
jgi:3-deoxy-D-manno-octulosonate 8-phosphate phosphatase (KDO 8-P phosphatase)